MVVPLIFGKVAKDLMNGNILSEAIDLGPLTPWLFCCFFHRTICVQMDDRDCKV